MFRNMHAVLRCTSEYNYLPRQRIHLTLCRHSNKGIKLTTKVMNECLFRMCLWLNLLICMHGDCWPIGTSSVIWATILTGQIGVHRNPFHTFQDIWANRWIFWKFLFPLIANPIVHVQTFACVMKPRSLWHVHFVTSIDYWNHEYRK